jgi:hypothetical protein
MFRRKLIGDKRKLHSPSDDRHGNLLNGLKQAKIFSTHRESNPRFIDKFFMSFVLLPGANSWAAARGCPNSQ